MSRNIVDIYPLSPMQQGILFHSLMAPDSGTYIEQLSCTIHGELDLNAFKESWTRTIERHDTLRSAFVWEDVDEPVQVVYDNLDVPFTVLDMQQLPECERDEKLKGLMKDEINSGFDMASPPLMKFCIIKIEDLKYYFIWTHHHILFDGWSNQVLMKEVFGFYDFFTHKNENTLMPFRPYKDYILWLQKQNKNQAEAYWRERLDGFYSPTPLGIRELSKRNTNADSGQKGIMLPPEISASVYNFARKNQLTLNTIIQGLWSIILKNLSLENDIVFGTTVSGRPPELSGIESTVGLFINTLPLRIKVDSSSNILSWLHKIQVDQVQQRRYEYCSLIDIQGWSSVPRDLPLFDSIMVFENYPIAESLKERKSEISINVQSAFSKTNYPLVLVITPAGQIGIELSYNSSLFDENFIDRILQNMRNSLENLISLTQEEINKITADRFSVLSKAEWNEIIYKWNETEEDFPHDICIHQYFDHAAEKYENEIALNHNGKFLTYRDLKSKSEKLAIKLMHSGLRPESIAGICADRSLEMIIGMLAVLKSGAAYLPLDPSYPADRIKYILEDSGAKTVLAQSHLLNRLPENIENVICIDQELNSPDLTDKFKEPCVSPDNLAYVIYTSGSTGRPKGTMLSHKGVINLAQVKKDEFNLSNGRRILQFTSFSFDPSVWEFCWSLLNGATLYLCDRDTVLSGEKLFDFIKDNKINVLTMPPSVLSYIPNGDLPDLDTIVIGGEASSWGLVEKWTKGGRRYYNAYGPTEATVCAALHLCRMEDSDKTAAPLMGRPIANYKLLVLDKNMNAVPVGSQGELFIGGVALARGYLNRPDLTAERFVPNPYAKQKGERLYRTGDLVRYLSDGTIEFLGRIDSQIKLRGFRIELQEIESQMKSFHSVKESAVVLREDRPNDKRLVGYIVPEDESEVDIQELQKYLKQRLPDYMIPSLIVKLKQMPVTTSGKIDRKKLALDAKELSNVSAQEYVAPKTEAEKQLASIAGLLLKAEKVGVNDNFFEMGGHSLLASQFISRIRETLGLDVPLRLIFEKPVIADLAVEIEILQKAAKTEEAKAIKAVSRESYRKLKSDLGR